MLEKQDMYKLIEEHPEYKELLFCKGYLITDNLCLDSILFPFSFEHWTCKRVGKFDIWHDERLPLITVEKDNETIFLLGHAYNPFTMQIDEDEMLRHLITLSGNDFWEYESQFTGVYMMGIISNDSITHWVDCTGMLIAYYGAVDGHYYITSHIKIVGDLLDLKEDEYITRLKNYKYFHYFGNILPGDFSIYRELKRSVPNHKYTYKKGKISYNRFFPLHRINECRNENEYNELVEHVSIIMRNNMKVIAEKWSNKVAAISVTGGKDSKLTLASTNGQYNHYKYFSYDSSDGETFDVNAAKKICQELGLRHNTYYVSRNNEDYVTFNDYRELIAYNYGNLGYPKENETRKRCHLINNVDYAVEVKSWVDEIGRARYYKRFRKKRFPSNPNARVCTTLYKFFCTNRKLVRETDAVFYDYIAKYITKEACELMSWLDQMYWEFSWSACEGANLITEHLIISDITIPYNSRKIAELLLRPSLIKRINDSLQKDVIKLNNMKIDELNIDVLDANYSQNRAKAEHIYFELHSRVPF